MSELSNAVSPTFNKTIKRLSESDALSIANSHMVSTKTSGLGTPQLHILDAADGDSGVVEYPNEQYGGSTVVVVKDGEVIWSGLSYEGISNIGQDAERSIGNR